MTRSANVTRDTIDPADAASVLRALVGGSLPPRIRMGVLDQHRQCAPDGGLALMNAMAEEMADGRGAVEQLSGLCRQMEELQQRLRDSPWHPARVVDTASVRLTGHVLVSHGNALRLVHPGDEVDASTLAIGDLVYLSGSGAVLMRRADADLPLGGETAVFERALDADRVVVRVRDEELVLRRASGLAEAELTPGCLLRVERTACLALERLGDGNRGCGLFADDLDTGGIVAGGRRVREAIARITDALHLSLVEPEKAARYRLGRRRAVVLSGPPGVGKTLTVKSAIAELARRSGRRCRFAIVRPGEFLGSYVGETEGRIRQTFARLAREAGEDLAVLYLDEIESIGRTRGGAMSRLADQFLAALLVEIDGIVARGNVAVIASTNRKDLLDPALLERLAEIDIEVPRPDMEDARAILAAHLGDDLPWGTASRGGDVREAALDAAVSMLYAPNAGARVARIQFRDGTARVVEAREMISGRLIEQVARRVRELACARGDGIHERDVREAVGDAIARLRSTLTVHNVRSWLDGLPSDLDIVRVAAEVPAVARPWRYLRAA